MKITYVVRILLLAWLLPASAADLLRVNTFPNAKALPFYAGVEKGIFAKHGLDVRVAYTENSEKQRAGLASGAFEIAHSAVDNAVAMVEDAKQDVVIVTGGDNGMNEFYVQPHIKSLADLRGQTLVVDAPNTAYAVLAKKILFKEGMHEGRDYAVKPVGRGELRLKAMVESRDNTAAILNLPFTIQAEQMGFRSFGNPVELLGPYQAGGAFMLRSWAKAHGTLLERYIAAFIESLRWSLAPRTAKNRSCFSCRTSSSPTTSPIARCARSPIRRAASRPMRHSTCRAFATCSRCAPRWKAATRGRRRSTSTFRTTSAR